MSVIYSVNNRRNNSDANGRSELTYAIKDCANGSRLRRRGDVEHGNTTGQIDCKLVAPSGENNIDLL